MIDLDIYSTNNSWIRDFTESEFTIVINIGGENNIDLAFTAISLLDKAQGNWIGMGSAIANGRTVIYSHPPVNGNALIGAYRPQTPFALIRGNSLKEFDNEVKVQLKDPDMTEPVQETGTYTLLPSIYSLVEVSGSGQINAK